MVKGKAWTRDELILAINLYCKISFGKIDMKTPEVVELAQKLGRTPGSVSYKLANFASIDPTLPRKGASNVSKLDKKVAFLLNQSAENFCKTILLVFTSYCPNEHHLNILSGYVAKHVPEIIGVFPIETQQQKDLFELLDYAYIGARYDNNYEITKEQLEQLAKRVKVLQDLTEKICKEKIKSLS